MPKKSILEDKIPCPRCNADSQKRVEEKGDFLVVVHVCPMCRYRKSLGVTTRKAIKLESQLKKYNELLQKSEKIEENYRLIAKIKRVQQALDKERLGIHGRSKRTK